MKAIKVLAAVALLCVVSAVSFECGKATKVAECGTFNTGEALEELKQYSSYQDSLIEEISTHCWENHDCECSWYDGDYPEKYEYMHTKYQY